jgi:hypothetical protein
MTVLQKTFHNSIVFYDSVHTHRWYDAIGPNVRKVEMVTEYPLDSSTTTAVNGSTITGLESSLGGGWVFTTDAAENDGVQMQNNSEWAYFSGPFPAYFGARLMIADVDNADVFAGFAITDTTILAACSDNLGFRVVDNDAALTFVLENTNAETIVDLTDLTDATYVTIEFTYDGDTVTYYVDGVEAGSQAVTIANMPDDEHLAPALAILTGDGGANSMTVQWARWIQILE